MFADHGQGERITTNPRSILRIRIQGNEAAWTEIKFESKSQSTKTYKKWMTEVLSVDDVVDVLAEPVIRKALDISLFMSVTRSHADLELLVTCWGVETHISVSSWGEFNSTLYDDSVMLRLPLVVNNGATGIVFSE